MTTFGQRLAHARRLAGLTLREAAEQLGVTDRAVSNWERDVRSPDPDMLRALARLYQVSADWLLGLIDELSPGPGPVAYFRPVELRTAEPAGSRREAALLIEALEAAAAHLRERYALA